MEQLGNALVRTDTLTGGPDTLYADGIFLAIVTAHFHLIFGGAVVIMYFAIAFPTGTG
jgi:hypothetical protein